MEVQASIFDYIPDTEPADIAPPSSPRTKQEKFEDYEGFVEKFKPKKTTDDCYTPPIVYDAIADYVAKRYNLDRANFVRPFYPGGDYENYEYPEGAVVVDNPPFSLTKPIIKFYMKHGIPFFLFASALTLVNSSRDVPGVCAICCGAQVIYDNGANVSTSFLTNLEKPDILMMSDPDIYRVIKEANDRSQKEVKRTVPKYKFPNHMAYAAGMNKLAKYGQRFIVHANEAHYIGKLDAQADMNKGIFGGGYLISDKAAAEKAAAEKAAAEKAAAEKAAAEKADAIEWKLSEREREIIKGLGD